MATGGNVAVTNSIYVPYRNHKLLTANGSISIAVLKNMHLSYCILQTATNHTQ